MMQALPVLMGAAGVGGADDLARFVDLFGEPAQWAHEAHLLIVNHAGLPPDALWLHLTARDLLPKTAESFAELPEWQQDGLRLVIGLHRVAWEIVSSGLDRQQERLREQAEAETPRPRVKLSDTIFEKHDRIDALVDGLRVNPRH